MNKYQLELLQLSLNDEEKVLNDLKAIYEQALKDIEAKIEVFIARFDATTDETIRQSIIYQTQYQQALKKQINAILDDLNAKEFESISDYIAQCYENGFIGTLYDIQKQGVPLVFPINQEQVVTALTKDTKLVEGLYNALGVDIADLKKRIRTELSRGISQGYSWAQIAKNIRNQTTIGYNRASRIARTEGHRVQEAAKADAQLKAKEAGADVVKQWSATLDGRTRNLHAQLHHQIREVEEDFTIGKYSAKYPGDFGVASMDIHCRCTCNTRARWALDREQTQWLGNVDEMTKKQKEQIAQKLGIPVEELKNYSNRIVPINCKNYDDFKQKYKKIWNYEGSDLQKSSSKVLTNSVNDVKINSQKSIVGLNTTAPPITVGGVEVVVSNESRGLADGYGGIKTTKEATVYTTKDGKQFVFPKSNDPKKQTMTPDKAVASWEKVPQPLKQQAQDVIEFVDYYNPADSYWRKKYKNFPHSYAIGGDKITFFRYEQEHRADRITRTYCHEIGHYIDTQRAVGGKRFSEGKVWGDAIAADFTLTKQKAPTKYGENSVIEDFAESVAEYAKDKEAFAKQFPNRAKIMEEIFK